MQRRRLGVAVVVLAALVVSPVRADEADAGAIAKRPSRAVAALVAICAKKKNPKQRMPQDVRGPKLVVARGAREERAEAVGAIAKQLGHRVERIELAALLGKYVGETEKNLGSAFERAERADAILFIDDADDLFGKRTDDKDAPDRATANQARLVFGRLRTHEGIVVIGHALPIDDRARAEVARAFRATFWAGPPTGDVWAAICSDPR